MSIVELTNWNSVWADSVTIIADPTKEAGGIQLFKMVLGALPEVARSINQVVRLHVS